MVCKCVVCKGEVEMTVGEPQRAVIRPVIREQITGQYSWFYNQNA